MTYIAILIATAICFYTWGKCAGFDEADVHTEYWFQQSQEYLRLWLDAIKPPDDEDKDKLPLPEEKEIEVVKAMAKGAGR